MLVVNDDAALAESVRRLLCADGYDTRVVLDGAAALDTLAEWPADLVLLDLLMPRMDGWQFLLQRKKRPVLANAPVLVWSVAAHEDLDRARDALRPRR